MDYSLLQWKDLIESPRFKSLHHKYHSDGERSPPILLGLNYISGSTLAKCNPFGQGGAKDWIMVDPPPELDFNLISCAGGLMFGRSMRSYVVLNPLTGDLQVLPPPPSSPPMLSTSVMAMHASRQRYWICLAFMRVIYLYDSSVGIWKEVALPEGWIEGWTQHCYARAINSKVYYYCLRLNDVDTSRLGVLCLDLENLSWSTEWTIDGYDTPWEDFLVSPALDFFKVVVKDSTYHLSRLDAASKGFVKETSLNVTEGLSHAPSCCYKDTIVVAGPKTLAVLDCKTRSWSKHENQNVSNFECLLLFEPSLFDSCQ
ncbi:hypothetical protein SELMODRAFT_418212 [Selaginella moellendorffii]|uniref:F-box associated domain-containing protein n=1 Tax=Selaginella moellendorffii TaxID=88036 RepID=D8S511_SELML|nr:hypothetical protein SELMODRAFT_418212 [Selaginella moellendorffii]